MLNEAHFTYSRENRPRNTVDKTSVPDTAIDLAQLPLRPAFFSNRPSTKSFGAPISAITSRLLKASTPSNSVANDFTAATLGLPRFFAGRYIFDSTVGFLHYASPAAMGNAWPQYRECSDGTFGDFYNGCGAAR